MDSLSSHRLSTWRWIQKRRWTLMQNGQRLLEDLTKFSLPLRQEMALPTKSGWLITNILPKYCVSSTEYLPHICMKVICEKWFSCDEILRRYSVNLVLSLDFSWYQTISLNSFTSVFQLAIAQHEERMYVEIAKVFENFVRGQSKVSNQYCTLTVVHWITFKCVLFPFF